MRQNVCRQLKLRTMLLTLLGLPLPLDVKKLISELAVPRVQAMCLLRVHNVCYRVKRMHVRTPS